jgi:hypothetical protein
MPMNNEPHEMPQHSTTVVLLVAAGLMVKSFWHMTA